MLNDIMRMRRRTCHSYLLRLWCEDDGRPWRASLQSVATEKTDHFPHVEAMFAFLIRQMEINAASTATPGSTQDDDRND